jgi:hypothetical protein
MAPFTYEAALRGGNRERGYVKGVIRLNERERKRIKYFDSKGKQPSRIIRGAQITLDSGS